jgi:hypothetical protein
MAAPAGSRPWTHTFAPNGPVTPAQFVAACYAPSDQAYESARLTAEGVQSIVHENWLAANSDQAEVFLIKFATDTGATSEFLIRKTVETADPQRKPISLPGIASSVLTFYEPALDDKGNVRGFVTAHQGSVVLQFFFYSAAQLDQPTLDSWAQQQIAALNALHS